MLLQKNELTKAQARQQEQRRERFAAAASQVIGAASECLFSLLPDNERHRQAADWYDACAQAMLRGNYAPLSEWIQRQACIAAQQNFRLEDLLQLLRICRQSAIEMDGWDEDAFSAVDDVIDEGIIAIRPNVCWDIPKDLNYLRENPGAARSQLWPAAPESITLPRSSGEDRETDRRRASRNRLALPIRIRCAGGRQPIEEITKTENVSLRGFYFKTHESYRVGSSLSVVYPYWTGPGSINREYKAKVTRLDPLEDRSWGVAVQFLQNLHEKST